MATNLSYVEPGVYVSSETTKKTNNNDNSVKMYPLILGRIPKYIPKTLTVVRTDSFDCYVQGAMYDEEGYATEKKVYGDALPAEYGDLTSITWAKSAYNSLVTYNTEDGCCAIGSHYNYATGENIKTIKWFDYSQKIEFRRYYIYVPYEEKPEGWGYDISMNIYIYNTELSLFEPTSFANSNATFSWPEFEPGVYYYEDFSKYDVLETRYQGMDTAVSNEVSIDITDNYNTTYNITPPSDMESWHRICYDISPTTSNIDAGLVPSIGSTYKIKFNFSPSSDSDYYKIQEFSKVEDVESFYGEDIIAADYTNTGVGYNPISTAAAIAKEGGSPVFYTLGIREPEITYYSVGVPIAFDHYVLGDTTAYTHGVVNADLSNAMILIQDSYGKKCNSNIHFKKNAAGNYLTVDGLEVPPVYHVYSKDEKPTNNAEIMIPAKYTYQIDIDKTYAPYYKEALDTKCADIEAEALYRIIPLDQGEQISKAVNDHVNEFSSDEERMECSGFTSIPYNAMNYISYDAYIDDVISYAKNTNNHRMITSFGSATRTLSNGTQVSLSAQYFFVYLAALEQIKKDGTGLTNSTIPLTTFANLDIPTMRRTRKNEIASAGVLIFEQRPSTTEIRVRHALTTKTSDTYGKEMSVQYNIDYTRKYLRAICNPYIGRRNVNPETLELVEETITEGLETLVNEGRLIKGVVDSIGIAEDAEDTIVVVLKVAVSFPLNYIYITLVLDN